MPWGCAAGRGVMEWADEVRYPRSASASYVGSIRRYSAGEFDACTMAMDALTIPAAAGVDSSMIIGDFSTVRMLFCCAAG
jgi:NitT/TauT family transport system substrate-binding protein